MASSRGTARCGLHAAVKAADPIGEKISDQGTVLLPDPTSKTKSRDQSVALRNLVNPCLNNELYCDLGRFTR